MMVVAAANGRLEVLEPRDFKRFSLRASPFQALTNSDAVVFSTEEPVAWISEAALRTWPGSRQVAGWQDGLTRMIEFARRKGWFDDETARIRAHIVWA